MSDNEAPPAPSKMFRTASGRYHITEAERQRRFNIAARLLMERATTAQIAEALGMKIRATQLMLGRKDFNGFFQQYMRTVLQTVDRVITGRFIENLFTAEAVYRKAMVDYLQNKGSATIAQKTAQDVFERCGIQVARPEGKTPLTPAQEKALENAARLKLDEQPGAAAGPALALPPDDTEGSSSPSEAEREDSSDD